ncbi:putative mannosyl-oligosaccharide 1 2-alpha-mannosidase IB [Leptomonas seymouri]|uniref:Putative mannosyl-oligosaccharide 1 2-alpha-mannosidase IB n=1 Tax=Leptomonas seymouri TaxID=5684 RepID=A0A0N1HT43_LEPSE|nr:putative mannosyl-oligosaccharide 1 2-alpha-mannosidase IB [Leptomonas seymouri]|eukprot:KPI82890.1 putative mannosyl-oligosaccharide 1 2-alpha-mannosidase IB [Leptomonas seymouri]
MLLPVIVGLALVLVMESSALVALKGELRKVRHAQRAVDGDGAHIAARCTRSNLPEAEVLVGTASPYWLGDAIEWRETTTRKTQMMATLKQQVKRVELLSLDEADVEVVGPLMDLVGPVPVAAHYMYEGIVAPVVRGEHNYSAGLLRGVRDLGERPLSVFHSPTGLPFITINLQQAAADRKRVVTVDADAGSFLLEFAALSRLTGNATYRRAARRATPIPHDMREPATELKDFVKVVQGKWRRSRHTSVGARIDSTVKCAVKYHALSGEVQELREYEADRRASPAWLLQGGLYCGLSQGAMRSETAVTQGLSAFYQGSTALGGHHGGVVVEGNRGRVGCAPAAEAGGDACRGD